MLAAVPLVFALGAMLTAMISPINAFAFDIKGSTAEAWVDAGTAEGIVVTLEAIPANESSHSYTTFPAADPVFDAPDRDTICCPLDAPFGLGVDNSLISRGDPGVSSIPSEIGFYRTTCDWSGSPLGDNCADELRVKLSKVVNGGSVVVSFFYGSEQSGETL